ncbi:hypothetical protein GOV10_04425 [Candidatus Woesearchaeota archaeon]|nr:hypothetical protein [Candidatus Woesearchaeota archaeon]
MTPQELSDLTHLSIQNMTAKRLREILSSMDHKSEAELVNSIRNWAVLGHSKDEVQTKNERLLAAFMSVIFIYEEAGARK